MWTLLAFTVRSQHLTHWMPWCSTDTEFWVSQTLYSLQSDCWVSDVFQNPYYTLFVMLQWAWALALRLKSLDWTSEKERIQLVLRVGILQTEGWAWHSYFPLSDPPSREVATWHDNSRTPCCHWGSSYSFLGSAEGYVTFDQLVPRKKILEEKTRCIVLHEKLISMSENVEFWCLFESLEPCHEHRLPTERSNLHLYKNQRVCAKCICNSSKLQSRRAVEEVWSTRDNSSRKDGPTAAQ